MVGEDGGYTREEGGGEGKEEEGSVVERKKKKQETFFLFPSSQSAFISHPRSSPPQPPFSPNAGPLPSLATDRDN